ncbi:MAG: OsmC family protein [Chitinophagaceae bacterium]|nr:OsmC family protein [Chitinophagaceae bacterium]
MELEQVYEVKINWTGNLGEGTRDYAAYSRNYTISANNKIDIQASSDSIFRGDARLYNPEELFLASVSSCHMLWYLHLCADAGIVIESYTDNPVGQLSLQHIPAKFTKIVLNPVISIQQEENVELAHQLHNEAHKKCFIANSCNFQILVEPIIKVI